jgi:hypothetical protein
MPSHPNSSAGRGLGPRTKGNYGQNRAGSKNPFKGASPNETNAPGENYDNCPKGPGMRGGSQNQSGGGEPMDAIDKTSRKDVGRHSGRD